MEDDSESSEWKIQKYSSSTSREDEQPANTIVKRIMTNGYVIGREIVITGIFISSAPVVIPSLVAFSTVGFVFSVPFGVLYASYACTNKIMSLLLRPPPPPPPVLMMLEYYDEKKDDQSKLGLGFGDGCSDDYGVGLDGYVSDIEDNELVECENQEVDSVIVFDSGGDYGEVDVVESNEDDYGPKVEGYVNDEEEYNEQEDDVRVDMEIVFDAGGEEEDALIANEDDEDVDERQMEDEYVELSPSYDVADDEVQNLCPSFDVVGDDDDQRYAEDAGEYLGSGNDSLEEQQKWEEPLVERSNDEEDNEVVEGVNQEVESDIMFDLVGNYGEVDVVEANEDDCDPIVEGYVTDEEDNEQKMEDVNHGVDTEVLFDANGDYGQEGDTLIAHVDEDVDERRMEIEDEDIELSLRSDVADDEADQKLSPGIDVVGDDDQEYEEDGGEYLGGGGDSLEAEQKLEPLVASWNGDTESIAQVVNEVATLTDERRVDNRVEDDHVVDESASVVFGYDKDVGETKQVINVDTTEAVTSESAPNVVFGDVKDVGTTKPVTKESASNVVFDVVDTTKTVTRESASNAVFGDVKDVRTTKPVTSESASNVAFEDVGEVEFTKPDTSETASNAVFGDVKDVGMTKHVTSESASNVVIGDVEDVDTTKPITGGSASNVIFGDVDDVDTAKTVTSESASNVVFGDVEDDDTTKPLTSGSAFGDVDDVDTAKPATSESASNVVFGDVEDVGTTKPATSESASNLVFGDVKEVATTKPVTTEWMDFKLGLDDGGGDYRQLERDDALDEERKGEEPLVESQNDVKDKSSHEMNEDAKSSDERRVDDKVEYDDVISESASDAVFRDDKDVETTKPVIVREIESEKLVEKASENDEPVGEMRHVVIFAGGNDDNNYNARVVEELDLVAREVIGDANKAGTHEKAGGDALKDGSEDAILKSMEEHLIQQSNGAREIGVENLLDERQANTKLKEVLSSSLSKHDSDNGNGEKKNGAAADNVRRDMGSGNKVKENVGDDKVKHETDNGNEETENALGDNVENGDEVNENAAGNAKAAGSKKTPSREENLDDEKIWEKIAAMRLIVGYKAPSQPTCIGELKALYVFTGVEPPASFEGDSDLNAKLKFLMAIVGVK